MPIDEFGRNLDYVSYFSLEEYIDRIDLLDYLLNHLEETSKEFDAYLKLLSVYDDEAVVNYWISSAQQDFVANQDIERLNFNAEVLKQKGVFIDTLSISHKRIHDLHNFVMLSSDADYIPDSSYRKVPVNISRYTDCGEEIFWRGSNPEDVNRFMNDFINIYKQNKMAIIYSNPFLRAAITSLIFNRIHPYTDGNGRTSRIIYNLKFIEQMNKLYQTKLMLNPLNLSNRILANKITYVKCINQIAFNLEEDTNKAINNWFDFILTMADEQLFYSKTKLTHLIESSQRSDTPPEEILRRVKQMKMSKLK